MKSCVICPPPSSQEASEKGELTDPTSKLLSSIRRAKQPHLARDLRSSLSLQIKNDVFFHRSRSGVGTVKLESIQSNTFLFYRSRFWQLLLRKHFYLTARTNAQQPGVYGTAQPGTAQPDMVTSGLPALAWSGLAQSGPAWPRLAWSCLAWPGKGVVKHGLPGSVFFVLLRDFVEAELNMTLLVVQTPCPPPPHTPHTASPCYVSFVPGTHNKHKLHFGSQARLQCAGAPAGKKKKCISSPFVSDRPACVQVGHPSSSHLNSLCSFPSS